MIADFEAQYAAEWKFVSRWASESQIEILTCTRPTNNPQLTGNIYYRASLGWTAGIMTRKRILSDHLFELSSRRQPAAPIIDIVHPVKLRKTGFRRPLRPTKHTSTVHGIVDATEVSNDLLGE
jgi:hypothetical protein